MITTNPPAVPFLGVAVETSLERVQAEFAVLGVPYGSPYHMAGVHSDAATAPTAFRQRTQRFASHLQRYDFDLDGTLFGDTGARLVDAGDLGGDPRDLPGTKQAAVDAVAALAGTGAIPVVLGGDDSVPILVARGLSGHQRLNVLQIDAHLDFRDEVNGIDDGYSSPMRRIREMPWVGRIVQVGMRGTGSARPADVAQARAAGNIIIPAEHVHQEGPAVVTTHLSGDAPWLVTVDVDGLDPTIAPATSAPLPGGLDYRQAAAILRWVASECELAGIDIVEHWPSLDVRDCTSMVLGRLLMQVIGLAARRAAAGRR